MTASFDTRRIVTIIAVLICLPLLLSGCGVMGYGSAHQAPKQAVYYNVKRGDTLRSISQRYGVSGDSIVLLNGLGGASKLKVGQRLLVGYRYTDDPNVQLISGKTLVAGKARGSNQSTAKLKSIRQVTPSEKGEMMWPVLAGRIVSDFGPRGGSFHDGLDIACPTGTPVYATHSGLVVYAGDKLSGYGNLVVLRHDTGLTTIYAHNSELDVQTGDRVKRGEKIAEVGQTGHASGPHLHFEVRVRDRQQQYVAVDPLPLLTSPEESRPRYRVNESLSPILAGFLK